MANVRRRCMNPGKQFCKVHREASARGVLRRSRPLMHFARALLIGLLIITGPIFGADPAQKAPRPRFKEYQVKAAYLLNFTRYIDWPAKSFKEADSPFVICILGQDRFGEDLRTLVSNGVVEGRKIALRRINSADQARDAQIVFISQSERNRTAEILQSLKGAPVLTVGETEGFLQAGGMVNFRIEDESALLDIDRAAAEKAGLKISSKLLQIANRAKPRG
jgi:hypothetical protein